MNTRQAGIYVRISSDRDGEAAGVGRQEADSRALAERLGWTVTRVYVENDTSAFQRKTVRLADGTTGLRVIRPEFRAMLRDVNSGMVNAVIAYDLDRAARDPRDLEDLVDAVEAHRVPTKSVTGSLDLSTDSGVTMARVMVAIANKASRDTSRRVRRAKAEAAEKGRMCGGGLRGYGYDTQGNIVPAEAEVIRRIAAEILAGTTVFTIARHLTAENVPTVTGGRWAPRSVHQVVKKASVAGLRVHRGEIVGEASWDPILERDVWERVILALESRRSDVSNRLVRWLSGVLHCSHCGRALVGMQRGPGRPPAYRCATPSAGGCGKIVTSAPPIESAVTDIVLAYMARDDVAADMRSGVADVSVTAARVEAAADEAQLKELAGMWGRKELTSPEYMAARKEIEGRLTRWKGVVRSALPDSVRRMQDADPAETFEAMTPSERRDVARFVFPFGIDILPFVRGADAASRLQLRTEDSA